MNKISRIFLTAPAIVAVIAGNIIIFSSPTIVYGLSSSVEINENIEEYNLRELLVFFLLFLILFGLLTWLLRILKYRTKKRRSFSIQTKNLILKNQKFRCSICRMNVGIWDYDHKDGNRRNNKVSNCQALCPICHAKKSRGFIKSEAKPRSKSIGLSVAAGIILIIILHSSCM
jgi:hypothetical protein